MADLDFDLDLFNFDHIANDKNLKEDETVKDIKLSKLKSRIASVGNVIKGIREWREHARRLKIELQSTKNQHKEVLEKYLILEKVHENMIENYKIIESENLNYKSSVVLNDQQTTLIKNLERELKSEKVNSNNYKNLVENLKKTKSNVKEQGHIKNIIMFGELAKQAGLLQKEQTNILKRYKDKITAMKKTKSKDAPNESNPIFPDTTTAVEVSEEDKYSSGTPDSLYSSLCGSPSQEIFQFEKMSKQLVDSLTDIGIDMTAPSTNSTGVMCSLITENQTAKCDKCTSKVLKDASMNTFKISTTNIATSTRKIDTSEKSTSCRIQNESKSKSDSLENLITTLNESDHIENLDFVIDQILEDACRIPNRISPIPNVSQLDISDESKIREIQNKQIAKRRQRKEFFYKRNIMELQSNVSILNRKVSFILSKLSRKKRKVRPVAKTKISRIESKKSTITDLFGYEDSTSDIDEGAVETTAQKRKLDTTETHDDQNSTSDVDESAVETMTQKRKSSAPDSTSPKLRRTNKDCPSTNKEKQYFLRSKLSQSQIDATLPDPKMAIRSSPRLKVATFNLKSEYPEKAPNTPRRNISIESDDVVETPELGLNKTPSNKNIFNYSNIDCRASSKTSPEQNQIKPKKPVVKTVLRSSPRLKERSPQEKNEDAMKNAIKVMTEIKAKNAEKHANKKLVTIKNNKTDTSVEGNDANPGRTLISYENISSNCNAEEPKDFNISSSKTKPLDMNMNLDRIPLSHDSLFDDFSAETHDNFGCPSFKTNCKVETTTKDTLEVPVRNQISYEDDIFDDSATEKAAKHKKISIFSKILLYNAGSVIAKSKKKNKSSVNKIGIILENLEVEIGGQPQLQLQMFRYMKICSTLASQKPKHVARAMIAFLTSENRSQDVICKLYTPPAPPLTKSEQRLILCIRHLQNRRDFCPEISFVELIQSGIEYTLFSLKESPKICQVEVLARVYAVLCRIYNNGLKLRYFIIDALYCMRYKAIVLSLTVINVWSHVIPKADSENADNPLIKVIVHLLHYFKEKKDKLTSVRTASESIRDVLIHRYKYSPSDTNEFEILDLLKKYIRMENPTFTREDLMLAFILIAKRNGADWCHKKIEENILMPIACDELASPHARATAIKLIGLTMRPYPKHMRNYCENAISKLEKKLFNADSSQVEEAVIESLFYLRRHCFTILVDIFQKWKPKYPVSEATVGRLKVFVGEKSLSTWYKVLS